MDGQDDSWIDILDKMRNTLADKRYNQLPQLSSSCADILDSSCNIINATANGNMHALLIGINYSDGVPAGSGTGRLDGCHNDVERWSVHLMMKGFAAEQIRILRDN